MSTTTAQQLAKTSRTLREALARRDALIFQMRSEGASTREIATAADLTHAGVLHILKKGSI